MDPLARISGERLESLLRSQPETSASIAVVDVRGHDRVGGHIRDSLNVPSTDLDSKLPELVERLADKKVVVFHCALSQERGPRAARQYLGERKQFLKTQGTVAGSGAGEGEATKAGGGSSVDEQGEKVDGQSELKKEQEVYVLDGGFVKWQEKYGNDPKLTEGYVPDIWRDLS